jgi:hypothetical protein
MVCGLSRLPRVLTGCAFHEVLALGREWTLLACTGPQTHVVAEKTRSQPVLDRQSREKCSKMPQNPQRPVHPRRWQGHHFFYKNTVRVLRTLC